VGELLQTSLILQMYFNWIWLLEGVNHFVYKREAFIISSILQGQSQN